MPGPLNPALSADAAGILDRADVPHGEIVSVDRDSLLFVRDGLAFTAWLNGSRVVLVQAGFVAEEPAALHQHKVAVNAGLAGGAV